MSTSTAIFTAFLLGSLPLWADEKPKAPPKPVLFTAQLKITSEENFKEHDIRTQLQQRAKLRNLDVAINLGELKDSLLTITLKAASSKEARNDLESICHPPRLALRPVHRDNDQLTAEGTQSKPVEGYTLFLYQRELRGGGAHKSWLLLTDAALITEKAVKRAYPGAGQPLVHVELSLAGAAAMRKMTEAMRKGQDRLAVVLNGKVMTAPVVNDTLSSSFVIEGIDSPDERRNLAASLMGNPGPFQITIHGLRQVDK